MWVYYTIPFGFSFFRYFLALFFNFFNYFPWLRITDEGSITEKRIWSILLIKAHLKWCLDLSKKSLFILCSNCLDQIPRTCHVFTRLFTLNTLWYFLDFALKVLLRGLSFSLSMHLLLRMNVLLDFIWTLPVQLRGTRCKWTLQKYCPW